MLDKTLFVALSRPLASKEALGAKLREHLDFMIGLEQEGVLFASGPFTDGPFGEGLTIVRAGSSAEARALLEKDPFVVDGLRTFDLREWHLMEGAIQVTVHA